MMFKHCKILCVVILKEVQVQSQDFKKLSFSVLGFTLLQLCGDIPSEQEAEAVTVVLLNLMSVFGETLLCN